jgi:hypothetical protein
MRHAILAATVLLAACGDSKGAAEDEAAAAENLGDELIANPNGTQTLRLEGNDSATFVDGELVAVNRAQ